MMEQESQVQSDTLENSVESGEIFRSARDALNDYAGRCGSEYGAEEVEKIINRSSRTEELTRCFNGKLGEHAYDVALLSDVVIAARNDDKVANATINNFLGGLDDKDSKGIGLMMLDVIIINDELAKKRSGEYEVPDKSGINLGELSGITNGITSWDSVIIMAARTIENLENDQSNDTEKLRNDISDAQSVFIPLCEIWALDAMAMRLNDLAQRNSLILDDKSEYISQAEKLYGSAINFGGPSEAIESLFGCEPRMTFEMGSKDDEGNLIAPAWLCDGIIKDNSGRLGSDRRILGRIKSVGSLANKLRGKGDSYNEDHPPMDIIGLTVLCKDGEDLAKVFSQTLNTCDSKNDNGFQFKRAASKEHPIFVQGNEQYVRQVRDHLAAHPPREQVQYKIMEDNGDHKPFQVAKFTGILTNHNGNEVNIEVQFLTEEDRRNARHGFAAHALREATKDYKGRKLLPEEVDILEEELKKLENIASRKNKRDTEHGVGFDSQFLGGVALGMMNINRP